MIIDVDVAFHLDKRAAELSLRCVEWQSRVRPIPCAWKMPESWGPTATDISCAAHSLYHASTAQSETGDLLEMSEDEGEHDDIDDGGNDELMADMEDVAYANEYHIAGSDSEEDLEYWDEVHVPFSPIH
jgi:hypothetical protein